jgi:hypothetical protein
MARPSPRLDCSNYTWRRVQIMKLLVMQLSPFFRHLIPLRSKYMLIHQLFSWFVSCLRVVGHSVQTVDPVRWSVQHAPCTCVCGRVAQLRLTAHASAPHSNGCRLEGPTETWGLPSMWKALVQNRKLRTMSCRLTLWIRAGVQSYRAQKFTVNVDNSICTPNCFPLSIEGDECPDQLITVSVLKDTLPIQTSQPLYHRSNREPYTNKHIIGTTTKTRNLRH